jgi:hypothetical protein
MDNKIIKNLSQNLIDKIIYVQLDKNNKIRYYYYSNHQFRFFPIDKNSALLLIADYKFSYEKKENSMYCQKY